jgi:hypothetical protein
VEGADELEETRPLARLVHEAERVQGGMRGQLGGLGMAADHLRRMSPPLELRRHIEQDGTTLSFPIDADEGRA